MTSSLSDNSAPKPAGRGLDLFFGDEPQEMAGPPVEEAGAEAAQAYEAVMDEAAAGGAEVVEEAVAIAEAPTVVDEPSVTPPAAPVATVEALPVVEPAVDAAPPPPPPPPAPAAKPSDSRGCLQSLAAMLLGALLGLGLMMAALYMLNQDLRYAPRARVDDAQRTIATLGADADALAASVTGLQDDLSGLQDRAGQLQEGANALQDALAQQGEAQAAQGTALEQLSDAATAMGGQVAELQNEAATQGQALVAMQDLQEQTQDRVAGLQTTVDTVQEDLGAVASEVNTLTLRVDDLAVSAQRSDRFLQGMRDLMALVYADAISATVALTGTAPLTATIPVTATAAPTATVQVTATAGITATPAITSAAPITTTPVVTATPVLTVTPALTATPGVTATAAPAAATPAPGSTGGIRGVVFLDANRDGRRDPATEAGLANVRITLYDRSRVELARAATDADGGFSFPDLAPGVYIVVESDPAGYISTSANILTVMLRNGATASGIDFGDLRPAQ